MTDESSHVSLTLESLKRQLAAKLDDEARRLIAAMTTLESMAGLPPTTLMDVVPMIGSPGSLQGNNSQNQPAVSAQASSGRRSAQPIRPDEYLGAEPLDAAKQYMQAVGHAIHFDEIADAVQRGGAAIQGANWREKLEISLVRSAYGVVKVQDKTYGLRSFYNDEQLKRLRQARRPRDEKKKKTAKKRGKANSPKLAKPSKVEASDSKDAAVKPKKPIKSADAKGTPEPASSEHVH